MQQLLNLVFKIALAKTIYFNLHCLPFKQGFRFPFILARGVTFLRLRGKIIIDTDEISTGMIRIGFKHYGFQTKKDITILENNGGQLIFDGKATIGKGTSITIGKNGRLLLGKGIHMGGNSKIICYENITIGMNSRIAWETTLIDTDFHKTINIKTNELSLGKKTILIGKYNWIGFGTTILKGTCTPNYCVVAAKSLLLKEYNYDEYCMLGGQPAVFMRKDIYRDFNSLVE